MKMTKRFISILCIISIVTSLCARALAVTAAPIVLDPNSNVTYGELPVHIQPLVKNNDLVIVDEDEHYHIFPAEENTAGVYALQYAPKGGTLLFKDSVISSDTVYTEYMGNVSYIPVAELSAYLIDYVDTSFIGQVASMALIEGATVAAEYGVKVFKEKTGLAVPVAVVLAIIELEQWYIQYANYNMLKNAYQTYCEGIETGGLITTTKYIHNKVTGTGNITTTYARWGGTYIQTVHSGKTGTFYAEQYYAGGEWF